MNRFHSIDSKVIELSKLKNRSLQKRITIKKYAEETNRSYRSIYRDINNYRKGMITPPVHYNKAKKHRKKYAQALQLAANLQLTIDDISKRLKVHRSTIHRWIRPIRKNFTK